MKQQIPQSSDSDQSIDENYKIQLSRIYQQLDQNKKITNSSIQKSEALDEARERLKYDGKVIQAFTQTTREDRDLKKNYAILLIGTFIFQLIVFDVFFFLCGLHILKFSDATLNIYITGGIIEIVLLIKIIVSDLFKDNITDPLKTVIKKK